MDLEEHSLDPVIERRCAECGAKLTPEEIEAALEGDGTFLCSVHALEAMAVDEEEDAG